MLIWVWGACQSTPQIPSRPFDEAAVATAARGVVEVAADGARHVAEQAAQALVEQRRRLIDDYVTATRASMDAFREAVPRTDPTLTYDVERARRARGAADEARRAIIDDESWLALELYRSLRAGTDYLSALSGALDASESGLQRHDEAAFLATYQRLVEAYNQWAEVTGEEVGRLNADLLGVLARGREPTLTQLTDRLLADAWPEALLEACGRARLDGPRGERALRLQRSLANRALGVTRPSPCLDAARPLLETFQACADAALGGEPLEQPRLDQLQNEAARFLESRSRVCVGESAGAL